MPGARAAVEIADERTGDGHVRFSWHPSARAVIVSAWRDGVCVASNRVPVGDLPKLIGLFARAIGEGAAGGPSPEAPTARTIRRDLSTITAAWIKTRASAARARLRRELPVGGEEDHPDSTGLTDSTASVVRWLADRPKR